MSMYSSTFYFDIVQKQGLGGFQLMILINISHIRFAILLATLNVYALLKYSLRDLFFYCIC